MLSIQALHWLHLLHWCLPNANEREKGAQGIRIVKMAAAGFMLTVHIAAGLSVSWMQDA